MENATERRTTGETPVSPPDCKRNCTKKTVDREAYMRQYMKEYRVKNKAYLNNVERSRYFKSQGMSPELMKQFGEISGLVYKMKNLFLEILYNNPEIGEKVIEELLKVEEGEVVNPPQEIAALIV